MSQNIHHIEQTLQNGYKWELTGLQRDANKNFLKTPLSSLPLKRFPILTKKGRYVVEIKGVWQGGESLARWDRKLPDVTLTYTDSTRFEPTGELSILNVKWITFSFTAVTARFFLHSKTGALSTQWDLLVNDQPVLENIRSIKSPGDFTKRVWQAHKEGPTRASRNKLLEFNPDLEREHKDNTQLWQGLVRAVGYWAKEGRSKLAKSIRAQQREFGAAIGAQPVPTSQLAHPLISEFNTFSSLSQRDTGKKAPLPGITNARQSPYPDTLSSRTPLLADVPNLSNDSSSYITEAEMQAFLQLSSADVSQLSSNLHGAMSAQPALQPQITNPSIGQFNNSLSALQGSKRKRSSLPSNINPQKRPHTITPPSQPSVLTDTPNLLNDDSSYITGAEMQAFLQSSAVNISQYEPPIDRTDNH